MITKIELQNVLAFRELEIEARPLTILAGTNSSGKSSLLHVMALLRQSSLAGSLPDALLLNGEFVELGTGRDLLHSEPADLPGIDGVALRIALASTDGSREWMAHYEPTADFLSMAPTAATPDPASPIGGLFEPGFQYLRADRIVPAVTFPKSHQAVHTQRFLGADGRHTPNYLRVHADELIGDRLAAQVDAASGRLFDQTNAWLADLAEGTSLEVADVDGTDFVRLVFRRAGPEVKTEPHRATNVGFGLTYALPIIVACLAAKPGSLILIENPEAHLHPRGQALLGRLCALCAAGGVQVFVETHSDHVLNAVRLCVKRGELSSDSVLFQFFTRTAGVLQPHLDTLTVTEDGMVPRWPDGFFDEWDRALNELLG